MTTWLSDRQALALPQMFKQISWNGIRINAVDDNDTYLMRKAVSALQNSRMDTHLGKNTGSACLAPCYFKAV
ncbi:DUF7706 family protein [Rheinheimera sediminis]